MKKRQRDKVKGCNEEHSRKGKVGEIQRAKEVESCCDKIKLKQVSTREKTTHGRREEERGWSKGE